MYYTIIDLFSGAGGLTLGFVDNKFCGGFKSILAIDYNEAAINTFNTNFDSHGITGDITTWLADNEIPKTDVVIGGPPCQGFSLLNKNRKNDKRRSLWQYYMAAVLRSSCKVFLIENVEGLLKSPEYYDIKNYANYIGYDVAACVLNAADYGVPQIRKRTFIIGSRIGNPNHFFPPPITHSEEGLIRPKWRTVKDAICDLPEPIGTKLNGSTPPLDLHFGRNPTSISIERYKAVPPGGNRFDLQKNRPDITPKCWIRKKTGSTDIFGRLWWDRPSVTIRTEFFKPEKGRYLHPVQNRPITHREAARLMGFPDNFKFLGSKVEIAKQIGNAVPPPLAGCLAREIKNILAEEA